MGVERENGKNKRVETRSFGGFRVNCPTGWSTKVQTMLGEPITGNVFRSEIAIDAAVRHRRWHFNDLVLDAVGHISNERIDASIDFRGKFRKHNKNKADGTLEVTLEAGGTYLYPSGTPPIVTEQPIAGSQWQEVLGQRTRGLPRRPGLPPPSVRPSQCRGRRYTCSSAFRL